MKHMTNDEHRTDKNGISRGRHMFSNGPRRSEDEEDHKELHKTRKL